MVVQLNNHNRVDILNSDFLIALIYMPLIYFYSDQASYYIRTNNIG
jgi:hypothetical protein